MSTSTSQVRCPECASYEIIYNPHTADEICVTCGLILIERMADSAPEWNIYQEDREALTSSNSESRCSGGMLQAPSSASSSYSSHQLSRFAVETLEMITYIVSQVPGLPRSVECFAKLLGEQAGQEGLLRARKADIQPVRTAAAALVYLANKHMFSGNNGKGLISGSSNKYGPVSLNELCKLIGLPRGRRYQVSGKAYRFEHALGQFLHPCSSSESQEGKEKEKQKEVKQVLGRYDSSASLAANDSAASSSSSSVLHKADDDDSLPYLPPDGDTTTLVPCPSKNCKSLFEGQEKEVVQEP